MRTREHTASSDALYTVGSWLLDQARPRDAADVFRVFTVAIPGDERAWLGLAECHVRLGQPEIALEMAGVGTLLSTRLTRLSLMRARLLDQLDREEEAGLARQSAQDAADGDDELEALVRRESRSS